MSSWTAEEVADAVWPDAAPTRVQRCRHCQKLNRFSVRTGALSPSKVTCGSCGVGLLRSADVPLRGLRAADYQHPLDRAAHAALGRIPGFEAVVRKFVAVLSERRLRLWMLSTAVRVGPDQFPELGELLERARRRLDMGSTPSMFLQESPVMNAMTLGAEDPIVVVHSALLDQMGDAEVLSVLGHELGHLQADHVVYKQMASWLLSGAAALSDVVALLSMPIRYALLKWNRASELTADRAALLASGDLAAVLGSELVLAGGARRPGVAGRTRLNLAAFIRQARELREEESSSWWNMALSSMMTAEQTHPLTAWRVMHLLSWVEEGDYFEHIATTPDDLSRLSADKV